MDPKYKLTYFDIRALGEFIRFLFEYGGIEYEDIRIDLSEWPNRKDDFPYKKLPLLEMEGSTLNQSTAIGRYLAKKVGLAGSDDWEEAQIDATVENLNDLRVLFTDKLMRSDEASRPKLKEKFITEDAPTYLSSLEEQVKENGGYFVNGKISWADLYLAGYHETYIYYFKDIFSPYPGLRGVIEKVYAEPKIKAWIARRPKNDYFNKS